MAGGRYVNLSQTISKSQQLNLIKGHFLLTSVLIKVIWGEGDASALSLYLGQSSLNLAPQSSAVLELSAVTNISLSALWQHG